VKQLYTYTVYYATSSTTSSLWLRLCKQRVFIMLRYYAILLTTPHNNTACQAKPRIAGMAYYSDRTIHCSDVNLHHSPVCCDSMQYRHCFLCTRRESVCLVRSHYRTCVLFKQLRFALLISVSVGVVIDSKKMSYIIKDCISVIVPLVHAPQQQQYMSLASSAVAAYVCISIPYMTSQADQAKPNKL
jgi:hypothetical protein